MSAPHPRYRLYTRGGHYGSVAAEALRAFSSGDDDCRRLESAICERVGAAHAVCMPQNRVGIHMAVRALVRPGRKILLSPYTLSDVVNMVLCAGAVPVFVDIERHTCNIDAARIEELVDEQTDAVLVTHLHGLACDMPAIAEICRRRKLHLLEDCAQAFGTRLGGRHTGTFGDAGVFSFGLYKNVNSFYGGMVVTPRREVAERIRGWMDELPRQSPTVLVRRAGKGLATDLATHPVLFKTFTFWLFRYAYLRQIGFLSRQVTIENDVQRKREMPPAYLARMTPLQARIALRSLATVDEDSRCRVEAARLYHRGLSDIDELTLPPLREDGSHIYTYFPVQSPRRDELIRFMVRERRDVAVQHLRNCAELEAFSEYARPCPNAARTARENILLSTYPRYPLADVERNVAAIREFYSQGR